MTRRTLFLVCMTAGCFCVALRAQGPRDVQAHPNPLIPLQVELIAPLDANKVSAGDRVFVRVRAEWSDPACHLRDGSVIAGHILNVERRSKENKGSSLAIDFDHADCDGRNLPIQFILLAVVAAPPVIESRSILDSSDSFGVLNAHPFMPVSTPGSVAPVGLQKLQEDKLTNDLRSDAMTRDKQSNARGPAIIQPGQVIGFRKIVLSVGTGSKGASVLSSVKGNVHLDRATQLMLTIKKDVARVPEPAIASKIAQPSSADTASLAAHETTPIAVSPLVPEVDETSICNAPCSLVPESDELKPSHASVTLPTSTLGFKYHDRRPFPTFGFESTLFYLDAGNVLFTYDPHNLRQRSPIGFGTESIRTVRAVLLDSAKLSVKRIVDWKIQGIWPIHLACRSRSNSRSYGPFAALSWSRSHSPSRDSCPRSTQLYFDFSLRKPHRCWHIA